MCGLLPCDFWLAVISYPGVFLSLAFAVGFFAGVVTLAAVQAVRRPR